MRKVHINGVEWEYEVGKRVVVIHPPNGKKIIVNCEQLVGERNWKLTQEWMNDPDYEGNGVMMVYPSDVKTYIEEYLK